MSMEKQGVVPEEQLREESSQVKSGSYGIGSCCGGRCESPVSIQDRAADMARIASKLKSKPE